MASTAADLLTDELHQQLVGHISAAADGDWRAAAWLLEHGWPDTWRLRPMNGRKPAEERDEPPTVTGNERPDPFTEVDQLAAKRQRRTAQ
jgi:hypothetical protein